LLCWEIKISYLENPLLLELKTTIEIERRIIMWKKLLILSLSIAVLFVLSAPITPANAGGKIIKVNWKIAGTIVQLVDVESLLYGPLLGPRSLINLSAEGSPGPAKITLLSVLEQPCSSAPPFQCESGYDIPGACFTKNDMVAIFPDQSLLFASIDSVGGVLCLNIPVALPEDGTYFKVKMNVTGGTGRFEGASSGELIGEGHGYFIENPTGDPIDNDLTLVGENGKITGSIEFSD
jgi:hypothetical protein